MFQTGPCSLRRKDERGGDNCGQVALEELERGEMLRSASDPEGGFIAYRLDHDYLTRGVAAAERRANRWHYLLEDGAKAFDSAGSLATQWKSMSTPGMTFRLAWESLTGTFRYGQQGNYALVSLARFVPLVLLLAVLGFGSWEIARGREEQAASKAGQDIWFQFVFRDGIGARDLDGAWMLASAEDVRVREEFLRQLLNSDVHAEHLLMEPDFVVQALTIANPSIRETAAPIVEAALKGGRYDDIKKIAAIAVSTGLGRLENVKADAIIEAINRTTDSNQRRVLAQAIAAIAPQLKPEEARALADPLIEAIKETGDFGESHALAQAFAAIAPQLKPEEARALAGPLIEAIKETGDSGALRALAQAFAAIAPQLKPEEARVLAGPLIPVIKGTGDPGPFPALAPAFAAIAPQLKPEEAHALTGALVEAVEGRRGYDQSQALAPIAAQLQPED